MKKEFGKTATKYWLTPIQKGNTIRVWYTVYHISKLNRSIPNV